MQNLSDDELDDLMRKASESQSHPYDADDWRALVAKLDEKPVSAFAKWKRPALMLTLMMMAGFSGWWIGTSTREISNTEKVHANEVEAVAEKDEFEQGQIVTHGETTNTSDLSKEEQKERTAHTAPTNSRTGKSLPPYRSTNVIANQLNSRQDRLQSGDQRKDDRMADEPATVTILKPNDTVPAKGEGVTADSTLAEVKTETAVRPMEVSDTVREEEKKKQNDWSRLALKLSYSPDWSANNFGKTYTIGKTYGLVAEYFVFKSLSISAGFLYAQKIYTAENLEYGIYTAEYAEGECRMWDIPVAVNYYLPTTKKLQFFGSVGLSSYLMNSERYWYYPDASNPYLVYDDEFTKKNKDWFKIINISLGAQLRLYPSLYLQIEPFVKAPLRGVGEWDISLSSIGTFISLKYQPKLKHNETKRSH